MRNRLPSHRREVSSGSASLLLLGLLCCASSCICSTSGVNRGDINLVPLDEEWRMGETLEQQLAQELPLAEDRAALAYFNGIAEQIAGETELGDRAWEVHLVADPSINAFIVPGGHLYIHTGLIAAARNVSEVAGVMSHEISHGVARHSTERMTTLYGVEAIRSLILGDSPGMLQQIVTQLIGSGAVAKFSRDDEREADRLGLRYLYDAGYNPDGMASMFEILLAHREQRPSAVERFFSSHPLTEERIENVRAEAGQLPDREGLITQDPEFEGIQRRLSGTF